MTIEEFVRRIVARTDGFESVSPSPEEHFNRIFSEEADGVDIDFFIQKVNKANFYEVVQGLSVYLIAYSREAPGSITRREFSLLLKDFFASSPVHYDNVVIELFQ